MACQPPSILESPQEAQSHFRSKHSVSNLLTSRATKVVVLLVLPSSLSCHHLACPLPHMCLLKLMCKKEGRDSSREAVKIVEKKITEEQPGYSALTDSIGTVKEKTDTDFE